jgi:glycosyltransferase involved in cell wall biosynthesis
MKREGVMPTWRRLKRFVREHIKSSLLAPLVYSEWVKRYDTLNNDQRKDIRAHLKKLPFQPLISVIMPVYNVEEKWLRLAIDSLIAQLYTNWELCIADDCSPSEHIRQVLDEYQALDPRIKVAYRKENGHISAASNSALELASGDYLALMDHDDILPEHAFYYIAYTLNQQPQAKLLYSDEDKIDEAGKRYGAYFKSDWNPDLFFGQNMFSHLGVYQHELVKKVGGFRLGYEGSQDYDLALRCYAELNDDEVAHIPRVLYHWRAIQGSTALDVGEKDYTVDAARRALESYFNSQNTRVTFREAKVPCFHTVNYELPSKKTKASIIINFNGDDIGRLAAAITSITDKTDCQNYEIIVAYRKKSCESVLQDFDRIIDRAVNRSIISFVDVSAGSNAAVKACQGEIIAFVSEQVEAINDRWLTEMASHAMRDEVGAVGAKLYSPKNIVLHGGFLLSTGNDGSVITEHLFHGIHKDDSGYYGRGVLAQQVSAVSSTCMVIRKELFLQCGGFDELNCPGPLKNIDLCLRLREQGKRIIFTPDAELYYHQAINSSEGDAFQQVIFSGPEADYLLARYGAEFKEDPFYSPNLHLLSANFSLASFPRITDPWLE